MDNLVLEAAVREARGQAVGLPVHRAVPSGPQRLMLLLGDGWGEGRQGSRVRIFLVTEPGRDGLWLTHRRSGGAGPPTAFQARLARETEGSTVRGLVKPPWERWVRLDLAGPGGVAQGDRALVAELFGAHPNLILLGAAGEVLAAQSLRSGGRLAAGMPYAPGSPRERLDPARVDEETFRSLAGAGDGLAARLFRRLGGLGRVPAEEIERRVRQGADPWMAFQQLRESVRAGPLPLYLPGSGVEPGGAADDGPDPACRALPPADPERWRGFDSAGEALDAWWEAVEGRRVLGERRRSLQEALGREFRRLDRLAGRLEADLGREGEAEELAAQGSALLAGLAVARLSGSLAVVPDPYDPAGAPRRIPIDPRLSLQENAERLFRRARKARRGRETVGRRLEEVRARRDVLGAAGARARTATGLEDLDDLEQELRRGGTLRLVRRVPRRAAAADTPPVLPIRSYRSADGMEILVGRSSRDNDLLTFKVASPHDFWLHAQGHAGAHVVVRNPGRHRRLPARTLEQAARLAAFHSRAREAGKVEVIVTQRRQVRKARGQPAGTVQVRRHESVRVDPTHPFADQEV